MRGATADASLGRVLFAGAIPDGAGLGGPRTLDVYAFVFLVSGEGRYRDARGTQRRLTAGSTITVFPGLEHNYGPEPGERWTERYVLFDGPLPRLLEKQGVLDRSRPVGMLRPVDTWLPAMEAITDPVPGGTRSAFLELSRLQTLLAAASLEADVPSASSWFHDACLLLAREPGLDLHGVAASIGMPYERFRKRFTAIAGESPGRWRMRRRMDEAARLLQQGGWTIREIARHLGFSDEFAFSRRFKDVFGVPPSTFRASLPQVRASPEPD
ncbi:helix-turn-helix transcriptional regulator [Phytoactinopolyspora halotolerans]|uniref:AraC family transcriptional regulator n=1 Tax=Phytoactinopolyspora halotolerans TaxID=1981512 RepID=A0A6L9S5M6_9ACTN|nr:helix-turn-helix domain-containing protein [Phytoactinopolyspora halotolerans]NEE00389.1 AraC family transcriptional regulator [Phytoactinopolyspora halotolerans]